jgi:hypothetical protein
MATRGCRLRDEDAEFGDTIFAKFFRLWRKRWRCTFHVMSVVSVAGQFSLIPRFSSTRSRCCIVFLLRFALRSWTVPCLSSACALAPGADGVSVNTPYECHDDNPHRRAGTQFDSILLYCPKGFETDGLRENVHSVVGLELRVISSHLV